MLIGVLSDTHIPYRAEGIPYKVLKAFERVDLIIHAGDISDNYVLEKLSQIAPVKAVVGNTDGIELQNILRKKEIIKANNFKFGVIHGDGGKRSLTLVRVIAAFKNERVNCIIFGHTHRAYNVIKDGVLLFNPGSATDKRKSQYYSYGIISIKDKIEGRIYYF